MDVVHAPPDPSLFLHVRVVLGTVVGLSIGLLLSGVARMVQHPGRQKPYWVHLFWVASTLLLLLHFWWWEFELARLPTWRFEIYFFVLYYAVLNYLMCAILFPTDLAGYDGYRDYFVSRRRWFFGLLATSFVADVVDTGLKASWQLPDFGVEYPIRIAVYLVLCIVAMSTRNEKFHAGFAIANIVYQVSYIARMYQTLH